MTLYPDWWVGFGLSLWSILTTRADDFIVCEWGWLQNFNMSTIPWYMGFLLGLIAL